jgi:hypothetical protein
MSQRQFAHTPAIGANPATPMFSMQERSEVEGAKTQWKAGISVF